MAANTPPTIPASSPRTPKSPPKKPTVAAANTATSTLPVATGGKAKQPAVPKRRSSKAGAPPTQPPAPPTVPVSAGEPKVAIGVKRPREEEVATPAEAAPTEEPAAKKPKREEWSGPPNEELAKRQQEFSNVESNQDAQAFLTRATEDFLAANTTGGDLAAGAAAHADDTTSNYLDFLSLQPGLGSFELPEGLFGSFDEMVAGPSSKPADASSPKGNGDTIMLDFFDFSFCEDGEPITSSKLDPPDLMHGSSANPSPESAAETPKGDHAVIGKQKDTNGVKVEDFNPMSRGVWAEINGGEPAYFEHLGGFKFEGENPPQEWAISSAGVQ